MQCNCSSLLIAPENFVDCDDFVAYGKLMIGDFPQDRACDRTQVNQEAPAETARPVSHQGSTYRKRKISPKLPAYKHFLGLGPCPGVLFPDSFRTLTQPGDPVWGGADRKPCMSCNTLGIKIF